MWKSLLFIWIVSSDTNDITQKCLWLHWTNLHKHSHFLTFEQCNALSQRKFRSECLRLIKMFCNTWCIKYSIQHKQTNKETRFACVEVDWSQFFMNKSISFLSLTFLLVLLVILYHLQIEKIHVDYIIMICTIYPCYIIYLLTFYTRWWCMQTF